MKKFIIGSFGIIISSIVLSLELYFIKLFEILENKNSLVQKNAYTYISSTPIFWAIIFIAFALFFSIFIFIWGLKELDVIKIKPLNFKQKIR